MSDSTPNQEMGYPTLLGVGFFLLFLSIAVFIDAGRLPSNQGVGVGPGVGMHLVASILLLLAGAHFFSAWRSYLKRDLGCKKAPQSYAVKKSSLYWLLGGLVGLMVALEVGLGFISGATLLFVCTARAFGQPLGPKSIGLGLFITALVFLFFTRALSLSLPLGPLEQLFLR